MFDWLEKYEDVGANERSIANHPKLEHNASRFPFGRRLVLLYSCKEIPFRQAKVSAGAPGGRF